MFIIYYIHPIEKHKISFNYFSPGDAAQTQDTAQVRQILLHGAVAQILQVLKRIRGKKSGMLKHAFNFSTLETEAGRALQVRGQPAL